MALIFVVDDQPEFVQLIRAMLAESGDEIRGFDTASAALAAFDHAPPDLVITDLYMPEKDGLELLMEIKSRRACPALLAITGADLSELATQGVVRAARALGADFLVKPFKKVELTERVERLLRS